MMIRRRNVELHPDLRTQHLDLCLQNLWVMVAQLDTQLLHTDMQATPLQHSLVQLAMLDTQLPQSGTLDMRPQLSLDTQVMLVQLLQDTQLMQLRWPFMTQSRPVHHTDTATKSQLLPLEMWRPWGSPRPSLQSSPKPPHTTLTLSQLCLLDVWKGTPNTLTEHQNLLQCSTTLNTAHTLIQQLE
jgi:hypothetical protein